jgi:hypothetical protein
MKLSEMQHTIPWKKIIFLGLIILIAIVGLWLVSALRHFSGYDVVSSRTQKDASNSSYVVLGDNIVRYGRDGAIYTDNQGHTIWNATYEMTAPAVDTCGEYLIIYDKNGTEVEVMNETGNVTDITSSYPITSAKVSKDGSVAALMQDGTVAHISLYNSRAKVIASGEIHMNKGGFPLAIALSPNGDRLMVSLAGLTKKGIGTTINFYSFGKAGKDKIDNMVASYEYPGTLIPDIDYFDSGRAVAIGTDKIMLYSSAEKPDVLKTIKPEIEMKSVFHNEGYVGYICSKKQEDGKLKETAEVYSQRGFHRYSKTLTSEYSKAELLPTNELLLENGTNVTLVTIFGTTRFSANLKQSFSDFIPITKNHRFYVIYSEKIDEIKLH